MQPPEIYPGILERFAAISVNALQRFGLSRIAYSSALRRLGKRLLLRAEVKGQSARMIASGLGKGMLLCVLPETPKSYWLGTHEPHMQTALKRNIKPGMVVYDCGANIGYFSVMLAHLVTPKGRIYAFEPSPQSLECLRQVSRMNELDNLTIVAQAVWQRSETVRFACAAPNTSLVSDHIEGVFGETAAPTIFLNVKTISLDEFVFDAGNLKPDFIKIDVEGAEGKALLGARRLLSEHRPHLLIEIHGEPGREVWDILRELEYKITNIATGITPKTADDFAIWITQYLAVPLDT
jgi:FkbM family methyltransferase